MQNVKSRLDRLSSSSRDFFGLVGKQGSYDARGAINHR